MPPLPYATAHTGAPVADDSRVTSTSALALLVLSTVTLPPTAAVALINELHEYTAPTLSLTAIRFIETGVAASITAIYPIFAMVIAARFHGDRLTPRAIFGALLAVAGVVVLFLR